MKVINLAKLRQLLENNQNNHPPSNPPQVNALTYVDKPQAFFLHWLQNQANELRHETEYDGWTCYHMLGEMLAIFKYYS